MKRRASTAATLPDELVLEILARVTDVAALFRCAAACEGWRRLIVDDPFFLRDCWLKCAHHRLPSVLGFFVPAPFFVPLPRLPISFGRSFIRSSHSSSAGLLDRTVAVASRGGLLLVRLVQRGRSDRYQSTASLPLAACDTFAGTCNVLPTLIYHGSCEVNYAILTDADFCSSGERRRRPFFKVMVIIVLAHWSYKLYTFSSTDPSWSMTTKKCLDHVNERTLLFGPRNAVVCHGTLHWLVLNTAGYYTINVSAETSHISMAKISMPSNRYDIKVHPLPHLSITADGTLSLIFLHKDGSRLETWTRQDDGAGWLPSPVIELNLPRERQINEAAYYLCVAERNGVLLIKDNVQRVYVADLNTGAPMEEVTALFSSVKYNTRVVPFEVDFPAFFKSRLKLDSE